MIENYKIKTRIGNKYDTVGNWKDVENYQPLRGEIVVYDFGDNNLQLKIGDGTKLLSELEFYDKHILTTAPELDESVELVYDGQVKFPTLTDTTGWVISGQSCGTNAGKYTLVCYPAPGYVYIENNNIVKYTTITWEIKKAIPAINIGWLTGDLKFDGQTRHHSFIVETSSTGKIQIGCSDTILEDSIDIQIKGNIVNLTLKELARSFNGAIYIDVENDMNYESGAGGSVDVSINLVLDDYSWETISKISSAGNAEQYFSLGDSKRITLNTKALTGYTRYFKQQPGCVTIVDFHHYSADGKGIQFQWTGEPIYMKEPPVLYALTSKEYSTTIKATDRFEQLGFCINPAYASGVYENFEFTIGSWENSYMRKHILGARSNKKGEYEYQSFMSALPEDLRDCLKPMNVYTPNSSNKVELSEDYITLPSEAEILPKKFEVEINNTDGTTSKVTYDTNFLRNNTDQSQYQFYSYMTILESSNERTSMLSTTKRYEDYTGYATQWLRSVYDDASNMTLYCFGQSQSTSYSDVTTRLGICPVFTV